MRPSPSPDLELLLRAAQPLVVLDGDEEERASGVLEELCARTGRPLFRWNAAAGLRRLGEPTPIYGTAKLDACLDHIASSGAPGALYELEGAVALLDDADRAAKLLALREGLARAGATIALVGPAADLPARVLARMARVKLEAPSDQEYYQLVNGILADLRKRVPVSVELDANDAAALVTHLRGLSFHEVRKVITQAIADDGKLSRDDLAHVLAAKRAIVETSGVLELFSASEDLDEIAGLFALKEWLSQRKAAFLAPQRAEEFGLTPPRGLLLLGVQGCGKSMCAKAVAQSFGLPLLRLDPARIYDKYLGQSEKNLGRAFALAERLAPIVLWIDELEKVFGTTQGEDSGAAQRVLGSLLTWLAEKQKSVFVVATSNDVTRLPPELLRKGRFDEIFFVDLPDRDTRAEIFALALARRRRDPGSFDLLALADASEGFSGAELEQCVVSALYAAFAASAELDDAHLRAEIARTQPLSRTMAEPISALRAWAKTRTAPAA